jgi:autotransporter passenger strand-loop-strand repeat protein
MAETIASGTIAYNVTVSFQNILDVYGTGDGVTIEPLAEVFIYSGGTIINGYQEGNNSVETVYAGALNKNGTLAGGEELVDGGVDSGSSIVGSAVQELENGGVAYNLNASASILENSGGQIVGSGGTAYYTTIGDYDEQEVESGGIAIGSTVNKGGYIQGDAGGTISDALVNVGGFMGVGGAAERSTINGGTLDIAGSGLGIDAIVNSGGIQNVGSGATASDSTINYDGRQTIFSGGLAEGSTTINNGGTETVLSGGLTEGTTVIMGGDEIVDGTFAGTVNFSGTGGILEIGDAASIGSGAILENFLPGETLILDGAGSFSFASKTGVITFDGSDSFKINNLPTQDTLVGTTVANGLAITVVQATAPCFAAGTRILTPRGEIAVENLVIGGMVITKDGEDAPIKWIGKRKLDLSRHPHPEQAQPIFFEADCLADGVPSSELILSPDHALYLDGVLVPAKALVNGQNIRQLNRQTVTYYHIELERHSIIFSESTPVETYLETGNRGAFENGTDALTLHPDLAQTMREEQSCAPFVETGPVVWAIRIRTLERQYSTYKSGQRRYNA